MAIKAQAPVHTNLPVLILQHLSRDGPAYLATWLQRAGVPFEVHNTEAGDEFPDTLDGYRALAVLGGEMSANDPLPSLRQAEALILQGVSRGVPVIGHCLGGQLMARALGAAVTASPAPEIGWQPLQWHPAAAAWFGNGPPPVVMQWHHEAFALPPGVTALAGSAACPHQAFALGPHLAMQFHLEVDAQKLALWQHDERGAAGPTVQDAPTLAAATRRHLAAQQAMADRVYARWLSGAGA
jgi:GMP synthase-like glutamine amidotransferase